MLSSIVYTKSLEHDQLITSEAFLKIWKIKQKTEMQNKTNRMECNQHKRMDPDSSSKIKASWYCYQCQEGLCDDCNKAHKFNKFSMFHYTSSSFPSKFITELTKDQEIPIDDVNELHNMIVADNGKILVLCYEVLMRGYHTTLRFYEKGECIKKEFMAYCRCGIALIPGKDVAVICKATTPDTLLQYVDTNNMTLGKQVKVKTEEDDDVSRGITVKGDKMFVALDQKVNICSLAGIQKDTKATECLVPVSALADDEGNFYLLSNFFDQRHWIMIVMKCDSQGKQLYYLGHRESEANRCMAIDHNGFIYIGGMHEDKAFLLQYGPDGTLHRDFFQDMEDVPSPVCMCFNKEFTALYVGFHDNENTSIGIFKCQMSDPE